MHLRTVTTFPLVMLMFWPSGQNINITSGKVVTVFIPNPRLAESKELIKSGKLVPIASKVNPMTTGFTPITHPRADDISAIKYTQAVTHPIERANVIGHKLWLLWLRSGTVM